MEIKLKEENIQLAKINIFVETKLINASNALNAFWAIDNVRICNENGNHMMILKLYVSNLIDLRGKSDLFKFEISYPV